MGLERTERSERDEFWQKKALFLTKEGGAETFSPIISPESEGSAASRKTKGAARITVGLNYSTQTKVNICAH